MRTYVKRFVRKGFQLMGYEIHRPAPRAKTPKSAWAEADFTDEDRQIIASVKGFTSTTPERMIALINAVRYVNKYDIPGAIAECGVWRGGSMMAAAKTLLSLGDTSRPLYLFDTFEGMTRPVAADVNLHGMKATEKYEEVTRDGGRWVHASLEDVREAMQSTGYDMQKVRFVQGPVEETIPDNAPELISILRLDTDWYESTKHELVHLYPRLADNGILIIDDYGHWAGAREATDEYIASLKHPMFLNRVDYTVRLAIKRE